MNRIDYPNIVEDYWEAVERYIYLKGEVIQELFEEDYYGITYKYGSSIYSFFIWMEDGNPKITRIVKEKKTSQRGHSYYKVVRKTAIRNCMELDCIRKKYFTLPDYFYKNREHIGFYNAFAARYKDGILEYIKKGKGRRRFSQRLINVLTERYTNKGVIYRAAMEIYYVYKKLDILNIKDF